MVTNAVAFNMGGGTNIPVQRNESENGFSDVLDSVNKASRGTSKAGKGEKFAYTEKRGTTKTQVTENASPEMSEKAGEVLDNAASLLKNTFSELTERLKTETDEEAKDEIISALLEILKKLKADSKDDEDITGVTELLMAVLIPVDADSDVSAEISDESVIAPVDTFAPVDERSAEIELINGSVVVSETVISYDSSSYEGSEEIATSGTAPEMAETDMTVTVGENAPVFDTKETAEDILPEKNVISDTPEAPANSENPADRLERLLNDILSKAKKDLGLTEAKLSGNSDVAGEKAQSMSISLNAKHSDRSGELSEILGKNTPEAGEVKNVQTVTETDSAVHLAANLLENTTATAARLENEPIISETTVASPEVQTADEILARMENLRNGETEFTMVLNPESLGRITVKLVTSGERVAVQITAENPDTGKLLEARTENLTAVLRENGVELERYQVVSEGEDTQLMQDSYEGSSKNPYGRQEEQQNDENDEEESFFDLLQSI